MFPQQEKNGSILFAPLDRNGLQNARRQFVDDLSTYMDSIVLNRIISKMFVFKVLKY